MPQATEPESHSQVRKLGSTFAISTPTIIIIGGLSFSQYYIHSRIVSSVWLMPFNFTRVNMALIIFMTCFWWIRDWLSMFWRVIYDFPCLLVSLDRENETAKSWYNVKGSDTSPGICYISDCVTEAEWQRKCSSAVVSPSTCQHVELKPNLGPVHLMLIHLMYKSDSQHWECESLMIRRSNHCQSRLNLGCRKRVTEDDKLPGSDHPQFNTASSIWQRCL